MLHDWGRHGGWGLLRGTWLASPGHPSALSHPLPGDKAPVPQGSLLQPHYRLRAAGAGLYRAQPQEPGRAAGAGSEPATASRPGRAFASCRPHARVKASSLQSTGGPKRVVSRAGVSSGRQNRAVLQELPGTAEMGWHCPALCPGPVPQSTAEMGQHCPALCPGHSGDGAALPARYPGSVHTPGTVAPNAALRAPQALPPSEVTPPATSTTGSCGGSSAATAPPSPCSR